MSKASFNTTMRNIAVNELKLAIDREQKIVNDLTAWIKENPKHPDTKQIRQERKDIRIYIQSLRRCCQYVKSRLARY